MTAHSYSSISTWKNCPRRYKAQYVDRSVRDAGSAATRRGEQIHKELEDYIKGIRDAAPTIRPEGGLDHIFRQVREMGVPVLVEQSLAVTKDLALTGFFGEDVWLRGKLDVVVDLPKFVYAVDWKSGKRRKEASDLQASVYSVLLSTYYPGKPVRIVFDYLNNGRDHPVAGKESDLEIVRRLTDAIEADDMYPPRPTPLCKWCPVITCEFNEKEV